MDYIKELEQNPELKETLIYLDIYQLMYLINFGLRNNKTLKELLKLYLDSDVFEFQDYVTVFALGYIDPLVRKTAISLYNLVKPSSFDKELDLYLKAENIANKLLTSN